MKGGIGIASIHVSIVSCHIIVLERSEGLKLKPRSLMSNA
jgi:hypothetical protein